ncbi:MAG: chromosomal replication initiator protein DnaA [Chloroflexota bacterium]
MDRPSPAHIWQAVLGQLQLQVTGPIFATYLRDTVGAGFDGHTFTVVAPSDFVREQLAGKLRPLICHTLAGVTGTPVEVEFEVAGAAPARRDAAPPRAHKVEAAPSAIIAPERETAAPPHPAEAPTADGARLNEKYTFRSFIVGKSNQLAHAAAQGVAANPGREYNPLFLYGGVGLGKTHLLHAIGHVALAKGLRVVYVSAEQFTNEFVNAIRERRGEEFRAKYRSTEILLIDDIQFIAGKEQTQEEFFHTFNDLHQHHRQIVITSDRSPKLISLLEDRLRSRFEWGLIADIQPPDYETRLAILRAKADEQGLRVPDAVLEVIAQRVQDNIRELEGSLNRVLAFARLTGAEVTLGLAAQALADLAPAPRRRPPSPEAIIDAVAEYFDLDARQLASKARDKHLVHARHIAMYLLRTDAARPLTEIGRLLGKRDHTTVLHGTEKIEQALYLDPALRQQIAEIRERIARA